MATALGVNMMSLSLLAAGAVAMAFFVDVVNALAVLFVFGMIRSTDLLAFFGSVFVMVRHAGV